MRGIRMSSPVRLLLPDHGRVFGIGTRTAVLVRCGAAEQTKLAGLEPAFARDQASLLPLLCKMYVRVRVRDAPLM